MTEDQGYGIPYAMHAHDVERLVECDNVLAANKRMREDGWVLLAIGHCPWSNGQYEEKFYEQHIYIMGVPRPKFCPGFGIEQTHPPSVQETWHHEAGRWQCPHCDEIQARGDQRTRPDIIPF